jgi:hypothetical protein
LRGVSKGWPHALVAYPSRLAEDGEHLRMTAVFMCPSAKLVADVCMPGEMSWSTVGEGLR